MTLQDIVTEFILNNKGESFQNLIKCAEKITSQYGLNESPSAIRRLAGKVSIAIKNPALKDYIDVFSVNNSSKNQKTFQFNSDVAQAQATHQHKFEGNEFESVETFTLDNPPETLEDALANSKADMGVWDVDKWIWNHWAGKYQVKVWFKRRGFDPSVSLDTLIEKYQGKTPAKYAGIQHDKNIISTGCCAILNLYDAHLDKIAIKSSTGVMSTIESNIERYNKAFNLLVSQISTYDPELVLFPVGNDLFHTNNFGSNTKKGTQLEYYTDPYEAYETICEVVVESIDKLSSMFKNVKVVMVFGNHDYDKIHTLSVLLQTLYANNPTIEIIGDRRQRKYIQYGKNLFAFAHGDKEKSKLDKLPLIMATEVPKLWAESKYRKFFCGDLHHGFQYKFHVSQDHPGVTVEFLRSIGCQDTWHVDNGYIGIPKTASSEIWKSDVGRSAYFEVNFE